MNRWLVVGVVAIATGCLSASAPPSPILPSHHALLGPTHPNVAIELLHLPGVTPYEGTREIIQQRVIETTGKRVVAVNISEIRDARGEALREWSAEEAFALADRHPVLGLRSPDVVEGDTVHVIMYFVTGSYVDGRSRESIGVAGGGRAVIMRNASASTSTSATQVQRTLVPEALEAVTVVHEYGHLLGLVNNGLPMVTPREDPDSPGHSIEDDSVMGPATFATIHDDNRAKVGYYDTFNAHDMEDIEAFRASLRK